MGAGVYATDLQNTLFIRNSNKWTLYFLFLLSSFSLHSEYDMMYTFLSKHLSIFLRPTGFLRSSCDLPLHLRDRRAFPEEDGSADGGRVWQVSLLWAALSHSPKLHPRVIPLCPMATQKTKSNFVSVPATRVMWCYLSKCNKSHKISARLLKKIFGVQLHRYGKLKVLKSNK